MAVTLDDLDKSIARWQSKLKRAVNTIDKLQKRRKRVVAKAAKPEPLGVKVFREMAAEGAAEAVGKPAPATDLTMPDFLRRTGDGPSETPQAAAIKAEQAAIKRAKAVGRAARKAAEKSGETRRMPLTGKAALAAIRGET